MLSELATVERAQANKVYPEGCILIQISATRGQTIYLEKAKKVESQYAVVVPNNKVVPRYLYFAISNESEHFMARYAQGLNIVCEDINLMDVHWMRKEHQYVVIALLDVIEVLIEIEAKIIELLKLLKLYFLENMFI